MDELKTRLMKFGLVQTCKLVHDDVAMVVITDGFSNNLSKTTGAINLITAAFPEHPILETCITEDNLCIVVLKKEMK